MCGIAGGWLPETITPAALAASLDAMRHRGPDDSGQFRAGPVFLGMRRLAIIDLDGGRQPLGNEDGSVMVVFNGEIYDYADLTTGLSQRGHVFRTQTDTEVLAHLYEEEAEAMCPRLRGMFAFGLWDGHRRCLFLARDRFGKKPLYYTRTPSGGFLFASELKALKPLAAFAGMRWKVREQGIYDYLSLGVVPQPDTVFADVLALPPGSWLRFDGQTVHQGRYWELDYRTKIFLPYPDAVVRTRELVAEAVRLRLRSDVPLGVFLSGGIDSSVVAFEASRHVGSALRTFTVAMEDPAFDESPVAARTARALGVQNTVLPLKVAPLADLLAVVRQYDQPYADSSAIPSLAVSRLARQHVTVVLNGDGGDEVLAGYRRYWAARLSGRFNWLPCPVARGVGSLLNRFGPARRTTLGFGTRFFRGLGQPRGARYLSWLGDLLLEPQKRRAWRGGAVRPTEDWVESVLPSGLSPLDTQLCGDVRINLLSDLLVKMDMATMAASVEGRSPFLDHPLAEFTASLPDDYRLSRNRLKGLLRDAYQGRLPEEVLQGRQTGFEVPLRFWLEGDLRPLVRDTVGAAQARLHEYLEPEFVKRVVDRTTFREGNWPYLLYSLLVLELWLREFA